MAKRVSVVFIVAVLSFQALCDADAQVLPIAHVGDRVRVTMVGTGATHDARLVRVRADSIWYQEFCHDCAPLGLVRTDIAEFAVARPSINRDTNIWIGVVLGLVGGAAAWLAKTGVDTRDCHDGPCGIGIIFTPIAALVGGLLGGVVGAVAGGTDWASAVLPLTEG